MKKELYHYTSLDALTGILQRDNLCFWATRYDNLNDPAEQILAEQVILPKLQTSLKGTKYESKIRDGESNRAYPYIVSFSKKKDHLDMWRLYNAEVALVVDLDTLERIENGVLKYIVREVKYVSNEDEINEDEIHRAAEQILASSDQTNGVVDTFYTFVFPFIKHEQYSIEEEVRLVSSDYDGFTFTAKEHGEANITDIEIPEGVKCRGVRNKMLLLYKEFKIPKQKLKKLVIRSYDEEHFQKLKKQIQLLLISNGYPEDIPIERTQSARFVNTN